MSTSGWKLLPFGYEEVEETGVRRIQKAPQPFSFPLPLARFLFICHGSKKSHNVAKCFLKKPYLWFHEIILLELLFKILWMLGTTFQNCHFISLVHHCKSLVSRNTTKSLVDIWGKFSYQLIWFGGYFKNVKEIKVPHWLYRAEVGKIKQCCQMGQTVCSNKGAIVKCQFPSFWDHRIK